MPPPSTRRRSLPPRRPPAADERIVDRRAATPARGTLRSISPPRPRRRRQLAGAFVFNSTLRAARLDDLVLAASAGGPGSVCCGAAILCCAGELVLGLAARATQRDDGLAARGIPPVWRAGRSRRHPRPAVRRAHAALPDDLVRALRSLHWPGRFATSTKRSCRRAASRTSARSASGISACKMRAWPIAPSSRCASTKSSRVTTPTATTATVSAATTARMTCGRCPPTSLARRRPAGGPQRIWQRPRLSRRRPRRGDRARAKVGWRRQHRRARPFSRACYL